jgi:hypothetical protein
MKPPELSTILSRFKRSTFHARLFVNDEATPVEIEYRGSRMTIRNLEDLPPYVQLEEGIVKVSDDGYKWEKVDDEEESQELQIYRILDPSWVLEVTSFEHYEKKPRFPVETWRGAYKVKELRLPDPVKNFLKQDGIFRWIRARVFDRTELLEMTQKDFPPFADTITLVFDSWRSISLLYYTLFIP